MIKNKTRKYFSDNALSWLEDGYKDDGYNYPVAHHRIRIVHDVFSKFNKQMRIVDLGCGAGNLTFDLVRQGHIVIGVDQSAKMIEVAKSIRKTLSVEVQKRVKFICGRLEDNKFSNNSFDAVMTMGVIYYFPKDDMVFSVANRLLKKRGLFVVSCRNRLFNMISMGPRSKKEIKSGNAIALISEIDELYRTTYCKETDILIKKLKQVVAGLPSKNLYKNRDILSPSAKRKVRPYTMDIEGRQHTPKGFMKIAKKFGFKHLTYYGVHPHMFSPKMNRLLPPKMYNKLSGCLVALEHLPISLTWSSHFIGIFKKEKDVKKLTYEEK